MFKNPSLLPERVSEARQSAQGQNDINIQRAFWSAIIFTIVAFTSVALSIYLIFVYPVWQVFLMAVIALLAFVLDMTSVILIRRNQAGLGLKILYWSGLFTIPANVVLFTDMAPILIVLVLVIGFVQVFLLFPPNWRKYLQFGPVLAAAFMFLVEFLNPPFRFNMGIVPTSNYFGQVVLGFVVLGVIVLVVRQAWSGSLRTKLLASTVGITVVSIIIFGYFAYTRAQQLQAFLTNELQTNVRQQAEQQLKSTVQNESHKADQSLSEITLAVKGLADYRAAIYPQASILGKGSYWDGLAKLVKQPDGQYINSQSDTSAVFIPNTVTVDDSLISDLNLSVNLDFSAPSTLRDHPNMVALYYMSNYNYVVYYPNFDQSVLPPDLSAVDLPWYTDVVPQNNPEKKVLWSNPYQDPAGTGLIVTNSAPVYDQNGAFHGVMAADVQLSKITENISAIKIAKSGFAFLIDHAGHIIALPQPGYALLGLQPELVAVNETPKSTLLGQGPIDFQTAVHQMTLGDEGLSTVNIAGVEYYVAYTPLPTVGYSLGAIVPTAEMNEAFLIARSNIESETQNTLNFAAIILVVLLLAAIGFSFLLSQYISKPVIELTKIAHAVAMGDITRRAKVETADEIGILASAFNIMNDQLRNFIGTLEARVAERTRNLELAAEVGRTVSRVRALDVMLKEAAELIREQFDLYYVQVYLIDPSQTNLILQSGTGKVGAELVGRGHSLPINTGSINGRAAVEKNSVVISDTATSLTFRPNPLLPDTCSEMAVPLLVGEKVVGVLDVQSTQAGALSRDMLPAFEALAGQLAIAIQNANLLAEANLARAEVEAQTRRLVRTGWQDYLDAIHQPEHIGFVFEKNQILPFEDTETSRSPQGASALSSSISVTGEKLGELIVEMEEEKQTTQTVELINIVARQVSQQIENLRLLDSAERYRFEAEQASRRLTREGWKDYMDANVGASLSYIYDLKEVRPFNQAGDQQTEEFAFSLPLKVRDETVGKLTVQGLESDNKGALELANAVAERLGAHIENLRLSEQTQERAQRERALRQITSAVRGSTDPATILRAAVRELGTLLGRKTVIRLATTDQASQSHRPTELVENSAATSGNEPVPPAEAPIADGGDE